MAGRDDAPRQHGLPGVLAGATRTKVSHGWGFGSVGPRRLGTDSDLADNGVGEGTEMSEKLAGNNIALPR